MKLVNLTVLAAAFAALTVACSPVAQNSANMGAKSSAIIGGTDVAEGSVLQKSIVGIYNYKIGALCTGSLIRDNVVLTAAHCVVGDAKDHIIVFATKIDETLEAALKNGDLEARKKLRVGAKAIVNSQYNSGNINDPAAKDKPLYDTALLKLNAPAPAGFVPATMVTDLSSLAEDKTVTVAGYGVTSDKLIPVKPIANDDAFKARVEKGEVLCTSDDFGAADTKCFIDQQSGSGVLKTTELTVAGSLNAEELVLDQSKGHAVCSGDSGGPAYVKKDGKYLLWGVASRVSIGCDGYVFHSNVAAGLKSWLDTNVAEILK